MYRKAVPAREAHSVSSRGQVHHLTCVRSREVLVRRNPIAASSLPIPSPHTWPTYSLHIFVSKMSSILVWRRCRQIWALVLFIISLFLLSPLECQTSKHGKEELYWRGICLTEEFSLLPSYSREGKLNASPKQTSFSRYSNSWMKFQSTVSF